MTVTPVAPIKPSLIAASSCDMKVASVDLPASVSSNLGEYISIHIYSTPLPSDVDYPKWTRRWCKKGSLGPIFVLSFWKIFSIPQRTSWNENMSWWCPWLNSWCCELWWLKKPCHLWNASTDASSIRARLWRWWSLADDASVNLWALFNRSTLSRNQRAVCSSTASRSNSSAISVPLGFNSP